MANRYRSSAILALVLASTGPARADRSITVDDAIALARTHNRDLRAARERVVEANAGVEQARAALLPTVAAQGKYTHNYKEVAFDVNALLSPTFGVFQAVRNMTNAMAIDAAVAAARAELAAGPQTLILKQEQLDGQIGASVPVVAPPLYYALSAARAARDASGASYQVTEADVLVAVVQAYFAAAGTDELVVARQGAVKVATETFDVAKARVAAELANQVESTRAETALVRAQQDLAEAENAKAAAYRALATLIGTHDPLTVQAAPVLPAEPGAFEALVGEARAHRPELAAERATIAVADASARASAWRWAPILSAFGFLHGQNYIGFSGDKYAWGLGLQLDWLLFDGG
ncbi:MAG TPA: TolC family protein, partial [Kofleriaceae bacterium]